MPFSPTARLAALRRPRLLVRAARFGITNYNRDRDLRRLTEAPSAPTPMRALEWLFDEEDRLESSRVDGRADYSARRHVEVLIALMAEARLGAKAA
ncbi:MAG: DUF6477 family protein [Pseudomonadota bacterium]